MRHILFPHLDPDAPPVPPGMRPRSGVNVGCGRPDCSDCYMPNMPNTNPPSSATLLHREVRDLLQGFEHARDGRAFATIHAAALEDLRAALKADGTDVPTTAPNIRAVFKCKRCERTLHADESESVDCPGHCVSCSDYIRPDALAQTEEKRANDMDQNDLAAHARRTHTIRVRELSQQSAIITVLQRALRSGIAEDDDITSDCASIAHHLRTAAERYQDHARTLRAQSVTDEHADGVHRLAFTFETQAEQCRQLATALDEL
jgi:hypothetical protein